MAANRSAIGAYSSAYAAIAGNYAAHSAYSAASTDSAIAPKVLLIAHAVLTAH